MQMPQNVSESLAFAVEYLIMTQGIRLDHYFEELSSSTNSNDVGHYREVSHAISELSEVRATVVTYNSYNFKFPAPHIDGYENPEYHKLANRYYNAKFFGEARKFIWENFGLSLCEPFEPIVEKTRFIVCGSRDWVSKSKLEKLMQETFRQLNLTNMAAFRYTLVEGEAEGVDRMARYHFAPMGFDIERYLPQYKNSNDKSAPLERNRKMVDLPNVKAVIAFKSRISKTNGTKYTIDYAANKGIKTFVYTD